MESEETWKEAQEGRLTRKKGGEAEFMEENDRIKRMTTGDLGKTRL